MNWASQCRSRASMQHILLWRKIGRKMVCHTHLRFTGRPTETDRIMDGHTRGPKMHEGERELAFWTGKSGSGRYHYCTTAESKLASCFCKQSTYIRYALLLLRALVPHPHHLCIFDQSGTEWRCFVLCVGPSFSFSKATELAAGAPFAFLSKYIYACMADFSPHSGSFV